MPGETIVLKYKLKATHADWYGPSYDNRRFRSVNALDRNGENKTWNIIQYSDDALKRNNLPHKNRIHIVGDNKKGEFYLEIRNVSVDDAGLYQCKLFIIMQDVSVVTRSFIVHLKCKY